MIDYETSKLNAFRSPEGIIFTAGYETTRLQWEVQEEETMRIEDLGVDTHGKKCFVDCLVKHGIKRVYTYGPDSRL